jgi:hypothetical protein
MRISRHRAIAAATAAAIALASLVTPASAGPYRGYHHRGAGDAASSVRWLACLHHRHPGARRHQERQYGYGYGNFTSLRRLTATTARARTYYRLATLLKVFAAAAEAAFLQTQGVACRGAFSLRRSKRR